MGNAARAEQEVARSRLDDPFADGERQLSLQDPEALVLAVVDVQRDLDARGGEDLHERQVPCRLKTRHLDRRQLARPPVGLALRDRPQQPGWCPSRPSCLLSGVVFVTT